MTPLAKQTTSCMDSHDRRRGRDRRDRRRARPRSPATTMDMHAHHNCDGARRTVQSTFVTGDRPMVPLCPAQTQPRRLRQKRKLCLLILRPQVLFATSVQPDTVCTAEPTDNAPNALNTFRVFLIPTHSSCHSLCLCSPWTRSTRPPGQSCPCSTSAPPASAHASSPVFLSLLCLPSSLHLCHPTPPPLRLSRTSPSTATRSIRTPSSTPSAPSPPSRRTCVTLCARLRTATRMRCPLRTLRSAAPPSSRRMCTRPWPRLATSRPKVVK